MHRTTVFKKDPDEAQAFYLFSVITGKSTAERIKLYGLYSLGTLNQLLKVMEAKRLIRSMEIEAKKSELSGGYPGNQEDIYAILEVDAKKRELDNDPDVQHLFELMSELSRYIEVNSQKQERYKP